MSYKKWFQAQGGRHKEVVDRLVKKGLDSEEIIEYFDFDNMVQNEPTFCPLYEEVRKCHNYEKLNCYLCACPNFRFNDDGIKEIGGKILFSTCSIDSKDGKQFKNENAIHQDCSGCLVPHKHEYIKKNFNLNWFIVMDKCDSVVELS